MKINYKKSIRGTNVDNVMNQELKLLQFCTPKIQKNSTKDL